MKQTFTEAVEALKRPRNVTVLSGALIASGFVIELSSYVIWRRFVIPTLIFIAARITNRIGKKRLKPSPVSQLVCTASKGAMWVAGAMIVGAFIDSSLLETPQVVFWIMVVGMAWIAFQMSRLEMRLTVASPEDIAIITESSDVVRARLKDSIKKNDAALQHVAPLMEKLGLPALH